MSMYGIDIRNTRVDIGSRHTTDHVERRDSQSGFFEELNAPSSRLSDDAIAIQSAMLRPPRGRGRIRGVLLAAAIGVALAAVLFFNL